MLLASKLLEQHRKFLESFAERLLRPYITELASTPPRRQRKEFNDPIWNTFILQPLEVIVLDCPLLQRLRYIRQLGVAHWVYPGATHTRFEHSIGVVRQTEALVASINLHSASDGERLISQEWRNLLRLAALCHDVGHGVMSHVSENALEHFDDIISVGFAFADAHEVEPPKPSEIAAYYLIGSPAFSDLLLTAQRATPTHRLPDNPATHMQRAVIGLPINDAIPILQELISGPFDADKLDYMPRDAHMSGIPVVTDVDRLIQKVRGIRLAADKLPKVVAKRVQAGHPSYILTGIALSGARTLDELMLGRTLLFDKIYRHQKVRTSEMMITALLTSIAPFIVPSPLQVPYLFSDDSLLDLDVARIQHIVGRALTDQELAGAEVAADLARRLRTRRLFVRAFAFATSMPIDPYSYSEEQQEGLEHLQRDVRDAEARGAIVTRICNEVLNILSLLKKEETLAALPRRSLRPYVWLSPPDVPSNPSDAARAYLITDSGSIKQFGDDFAETRSWTDAYPLTRDIGFVFAPREVAVFVFLAAEKVTREHYGVRIPDSMLDYAKQDVAQLRDMRARLNDAGYYASSPSDLRPMPTRLSRADVPQTVAEIGTKLSGYNGAAAHAELGKGSFGQQRILDWLRQFESDEFIEAGLSVLQHVLFLGRDAFVSAVDSFVQTHPQFKGASIFPLGEPKDSSSVVTYYAGDLQSRHGLRVTALSDALTSDGPILFADDLIGSGAQTAGIIEAWLGTPITTQLNEARKELVAPLQQALRTQPLGFVFAAGMLQGVDRLRSRLSELNLNAVVEARQLDLPQAFGRNLFPSPKKEQRFKDKCAEIGLALLVNEADGHDEAWAQARLLGYGNEALLVVFSHNTPAHTLTCLWKAGTVNGIPWTPLFPRRDKH